MTPFPVSVGQGTQYTLFTSFQLIFDFVTANNRKFWCSLPFSLQKSSQTTGIPVVQHSVTRQMSQKSPRANSASHRGMKPLSYKAKTPQ